MKHLLLFLLPVASLAFADIVAKPDGSVSCSGTPSNPCYGTINPTTGGTIMCQGKVCLEIKRPPKDDK